MVPRSRADILQTDLLRNVLKLGQHRQRLLDPLLRQPHPRERRIFPFALIADIVADL